MHTPTPTLYQINNSSDIATMMVQKDVLTTQVPQLNDGIAATTIQEDVPPTQAPTQALQVNAGSDTVHSIKYR